MILLAYKFILVLGTLLIIGKLFARILDESSSISTSIEGILNPVP